MQNDPIKSFTAITHEIDDVEGAVSEILRQLDLNVANRLYKNTVGIVSCYAEYAASGVFAALADALPFDLIGATTIANMSAGEQGETMLCLMVLTSDEVSFATGLSSPVTAEDPEILRGAYMQALDKLPGKPSLMLSFLPLLNHFSSDFYIEHMTEISGNVPDFGTLAVDHNLDYRDSQSLLNGEGWRDRIAILLLYGPVSPAFYLGTVSSEKVFADKGVVTASEGNRLMMVDGAPVMKYLQSLGFTKNEDGSVDGINSFPILVDYNDGTAPVVRAMFAVTPEGYVVCGGNVPVGVTLSVASFDKDEIVSTTRRTLQGALADGRHRTWLIYSCIGRYFALGYDTAAERAVMLGALQESGVTYMASYSGGEFCPVYGKNAEHVNRNHNNSFVACGF